MKIAFCGGGTLGHIYPAISIINEYHKMYPQDKITFICNIKDQEKLKELTKLVNKVYYFNCYGRNKNIFKNIKMIFYNLKEIKKIKKTLKNENFDLIFGMGGYISGMVIKCAQKLRIPTIIHEQNRIIGLSNKLVVKDVNLFLTTYPMPKYNQNQLLIGNPRYYEAKQMKESNFHSSKNILITSGTIGSKKINEMAIDFLNSEFSKNYTTTLITGVKYFDEVKEKLKSGIHYEVLAFSNDMLKLMKTSGIVISRSGSTTIFEILGTGAIPIFIPSPNVTSNHQYYNAKYITDLGIGELIKENELTIELLKSTIKKIDDNYDDYLTSLKNYTPPSTLKEIMDHILKFRKH